MHNCGGLCVVNNRGVGGRLGRAAGPAAQPPTRAKPVCFDAVETACGRKAAVCGNLRGAPAGDFREKVCECLRRGVKKSAITFGGERFLENLVCTPARRGHPFVPTKGCKSGLGLRPKNPVALLRWIRKAFFLRKKPSVLHADGLKRCL